MTSAGPLVPRATATSPLPNTTSETIEPRVDSALCINVDYTYEPLTAVICTMYIVFGIVYTLFGYRCFKASMFLTGFTFGSAVVYLICMQEYLLPAYGNAAVSICAGVMFGLINMLIQYVGLFITGFHTGILLALGALATYDHFLVASPKGYWLVAMTLVLSGIFFAVVNLYFKRAMTVFGTSVYGGAVIAVCVDYYIGKFSMLIWLWDRAKLELLEPPPCRLSWLSLAAWPATALVGLITQCVFTATGLYHEESIGAQKRRINAQQRQPMSREERAEIKQRKYRYLYQVRTAHGDVISQSYVQALQKKAQCGHWSGAGGVVVPAAAGECSTLQSDSTHLTVLAGSEPAHTDSDDDVVLATGRLPR